MTIFFDRTRYLNLRATLNRLLSLKVVPIINEKRSCLGHRMRSSRRRPFRRQRYAVGFWWLPNLRPMCWSF